MRIGVCAGAVLCAAAAVGPARAQSGASTILGGPPPSAIRQVPIDTSKLVVAPSMTTSQSAFSLTGIFRRITSPGLPTSQGVSALPSPSSFPSTRYPSGKMVGTPPYQLGNPQAARFPFLPVIPILNPIKPIGQ
jgi:hypothetical protein